MQDRSEVDIGGSDDCGMRFRLFKISFEISVPFAVMIAFLLIMDRTGLMSASLFAAVLHELGHIAAMKITNCAPKAVKCCPAGVLIVGDTYKTAIGSAFIAISGPLANFAATVLLLLAGHITKSQSAYIFAAVQFITGAVNMLPVKGLDGGTLMLILLRSLKLRSPEFVYSFISIFTAVASVVAGVAVAVRNTANPSLLLLGIYLAVLNIMKR